MEMLKLIENHKYFTAIVFSVLALFLIICIILPNSCWRLNSEEHIGKVVVTEPNGKEHLIIKEDVIEELDLQFHRHILFSALSLDEGNDESYNVIFYDNKNSPFRGFSYDSTTKRIYPGEAILPKETIKIMDVVVDTEKQT